MMKVIIVWLDSLRIIADCGEMEPELYTMDWPVIVINQIYHYICISPFFRYGYYNGQ